MVKKAIKKINKIFEPKGVCSHPVSCAFERWAVQIHHRVLLSFLLAVLTTLFSRINPICTGEKCANYFFQAFFDWNIISNQMLMQNIFSQFAIAMLFFFFVWLIIISAAVWTHIRRWTHDLVIPVIVIFLMIFIIGATTGVLPLLFLETKAIDCVSNADCIKAGYCGEVCVSAYQRVYTTFDPNCEPLQSCACINNKCVGS